MGHSYNIFGQYTSIFITLLGNGPSLTAACPIFDIITGSRTVKCHHFAGKIAYKDALQL